MAKKLAGLSNKQIFKLVKDQIIEYERYEAGQLKVIGLPPNLRKDSIVNEKFSFLEWLEQYRQYPAIKVEGLEDIKRLRSAFSSLKPKDIHMFVSQRTSYSFKWHTDDLNVYLYVIAGEKRVEIKNRVHVVRAGNGVFIPKGHLHRVLSKRDTWALSVGF